MAGVPLTRRRLAADGTRVAVTVAAVAVAVALVLVLAGLRRGMSEQVTLYLDHQAPVLVAQAGSRNFLAQTSVLPEGLASRLERVPGLAAATPVSQEFAMLRLHERRVVAVLVGFDPGRGGGPWALASGREPRAPGEVVLDRVLADDHGFGVGSTLAYRGARLRVVGLSRGTAAWMTPLAFATRSTVNALGRRPGTANFFFVRPRPGITPTALTRRIEEEVPEVAALTRDEAAANDRRLFVGAFEGPLVAMVSVAAAVAVLVIGLTVYSSTAERRREYATLKAIGLGGGALLRLAAAQALVLAAAGTVAGTGLAIAASSAIPAVAPRYLVVVGAGSVALMAAAALAMALVAAVVPARYLARLDPATAFRR